MKICMLKIVSIIGHEVQSACRDSLLFSVLCDCLLSSNQDIQENCCKGLNSLLFNCGFAIDEILIANGVESLVLLLRSTHATVQHNAALCLITVFSLQQHTGDEASLNKERVRKAKHMFLELEGLQCVVESMMISPLPEVSSAGAKLLLLLSNGPEAQFVKASGAVPRIVSLLNSKDPETQCSVCVELY